METAAARRGSGSSRMVLSGGRVVLANEVLEASLVFEDGRITEIARRNIPRDTAGDFLDCSGRIIVPGMIDVHVHGVDGTDTLEGGDAIARIAERLPRYGVTGFCPTSIACSPQALTTMLDAVRAARGASTGARVLPAHLESNFINPEYRGAQPLDCLRSPRGRAAEGTFSGGDILDVISRARHEVGIMTVAPELESALELIRDLVSQGIEVSLGHSGATYDQAIAGIEAGARQATHLFNRMTPLHHRAPGLTGAVLESGSVCAEVICDGVHVHPGMVRMAYAAKGASAMMAITDGTAGSGMARGSQAALGGRPIRIADAAYLEDGTIAGSVLTMNQAFAALVRDIKLSLPDAARSCATTPARALGLADTGEIAEGYTADVVVLDEDFQVVATCIAGSLAFARQ
jgi:N-acetylglucosamine-6-phosphate deacetylase